MKIHESQRVPPHTITMQSLLNDTKDDLVDIRRKPWIFTCQVLVAFGLAFAFGFLARNLF